MMMMALHGFLAGKYRSHSTRRYVVKVPLVPTVPAGSQTLTETIFMVHTLEPRSWDKITNHLVQHPSRMVRQKPNGNRSQFAPEASIDAVNRALLTGSLKFIARFWGTSGRIFLIIIK